MSDYRVELEAFSGPMDLLLHLVQEQEVDVREVSISLLLKGYLAYLEQIRALDLNEAADFLVLASTLLEIKSRELLPHEEVDLDDALDPRDRLVGQLLEYRRFRELARRLGEAWARRGAMHSRGAADRVHPPAEEEAVDADDLDIWHLLNLYARIVRQVGLQRTFRVEQERKPIAYYLQGLLDRLLGLRQATFVQLFDPEEGRPGLVGTFVALLELVKRGFATCVQEENLGAIHVAWCGPEPCTAEDVLAADGGPEAGSPPASAGPAESPAAG